MAMQLATAFTFIEQRRQALAQEAPMFGQGHHDSIVQRGLDEALACRDMLQPAPAQPSPVSRLTARLVAAVRAIVHRGIAGERRAASADPRVTR